MEKIKVTIEYVPSTLEREASGRYIIDIYGKQTPYCFITTPFTVVSLYFDTKKQVTEFINNQKFSTVKSIKIDFPVVMDDNGIEHSNYVGAY